MKKWSVLAFLFIMSLGLAGCPDDPPPTTTPPITPPPVITPPTTTPPTTTPPVVKKRGIALPSKISVIPTKAKPAGSAKPGLLSKMRVLQAATGPETDYGKAETETYVAEHDLELASIIEEILLELAQTNYAEPENIDLGPYKALVSWEESTEGRSQKFTETWTVDSKLTMRGDKEISEVKVWIEDPADPYGGPYLTKVLFEIFAPATQNSDGSYKNYGVWTINASTKDIKGDQSDNFSVDVGISGDGGATIKIHANFSEKENDTLTKGEFKAALNQMGNTGFGKTSFKFETCAAPTPCTSATTTATAYAYNENHLAIKEGDAQTVFKDRNNITEITEEYGVFLEDTGQDILKTKSFGFPVEFTMNGQPQEGYYSAWQGRHFLSRNDGGSTSTPTIVRSYAIGDKGAEEFTVKEIEGVLSLIKFEQASLSDIANISTEVPEYTNMDIVFNGTNWVDCESVITFGPPIECSSDSRILGDPDFDLLRVSPGDYGTRINILGTLQNTDGAISPVEYVYLSQDPLTNRSAGFYEVTQSGELKQGQGPLVPASGTQLSVFINKRIFIEYTGTEWIEKGVASFDEKTREPIFDPSTDSPYELDLNREYPINAYGSYFVVKKINVGENTYDFVQKETHETIHPGNAAGLTGITFQFAGTGAGGPTFQFITSPTTAETFMRLVNTTDNQIVTTDMRLVGTIAGGSTIHAKWEYPQGDDNWAKQQFLVKANGSYMILDNPIVFKPIELVRNDGTKKMISLEYDGWLHGLPEFFFELSQNNFNITKDIADRVINIPAGTELIDAKDGTKYLVKPLVISQYLHKATGSVDLDVTQAVGVDLSTVGAFPDNGMGEIPANAVLKYTEGQKIKGQ